jgi:hypothetical protein
MQILPGQAQYPASARRMSRICSPGPPRDCNVVGCGVVSPAGAVLVAAWSFSTTRCGAAVARCRQRRRLPPKRSPAPSLTRVIPSGGPASPPTGENPRRPSTENSPCLLDTPPSPSRMSVRSAGYGPAPLASRVGPRTPARVGDHDHEGRMHAHIGVGEVTHTEFRVHAILPVSETILIPLGRVGSALGAISARWGCNLAAPGCAPPLP